MDRMLYFFGAFMVAFMWPKHLISLSNVIKILYKGE